MSAEMSGHTPRGRRCCQSSTGVSLHKQASNFPKAGRSIPHSHLRPRLVSLDDIRSPRTNRRVKVFPPSLEPQHRVHDALDSVDLRGERDLVNQRRRVFLGRPPPALAKPREAAVFTGLVCRRPLRPGGGVGPRRAGKCRGGHCLYVPRGIVWAGGLCALACRQDHTRCRGGGRTT